MIKFYIACVRQDIEGHFEKVNIFTLQCVHCQKIHFKLMQHMFSLKNV
jgi:hypothetical protein